MEGKGCSGTRQRVSALVAALTANGGVDCTCMAPSKNDSMTREKAAVTGGMSTGPSKLTTTAEVQS